MPTKWIIQADAVEWLAANTDPQLDLMQLGALQTVQLAAHLWKVHPWRIAERVATYRLQQRAAAVVPAPVVPPSRKVRKR